VALPSRSGSAPRCVAARPVDSRRRRVGGTEEALATLDRLGDQERARIVNRASFSCSLSSAGWAGLEPGVHYLFTVEAVRRLVARRDQWCAAALGARPEPAADLADAAELGHLRPQRGAGGARGAGGTGRGALAATDRRPRQHRPGDPGGDHRAADRAGRRALPQRARSSTCASNCSRQRGSREALDPMAGHLSAGSIRTRRKGRHRA